MIFLGNDWRVNGDSNDEAGGFAGFRQPGKFKMNLLGFPTFQEFEMQTLTRDEIEMVSGGEVTAVGALALGSAIGGGVGLHAGMAQGLAGAALATAGGIGAAAGAALVASFAVGYIVGTAIYEAATK